MSWPKWMPPSRGQESDTFCEKHQCQKTWMITSGFCPKCEQEAHGDKGALPQADDEHIDLEVTVPDFKIIKHCIDCALGIAHLYTSKCAILGTVPHLAHCNCKTMTSHKWDGITEFYRCQSCFGYSREVNYK